MGKLDFRPKMSVTSKDEGNREGCAQVPLNLFINYKYKLCAYFRLVLDDFELLGINFGMTLGWSRTTLSSSARF